MEELSFNKSLDYTENLELDAFNWTAGLVHDAEFATRSTYQQNFLKKQYHKILSRLSTKY